ncbi:MAG TPA: PIN domain-containing protein [Polyangia bacterium]
MNVIVDTSVWSLALRRRRAIRSAEVVELAELIREGRAALIGPVRQELLSGVPGAQQFETLRGYLQAFPDIALGSEDYEEAAGFFNRCRAKGVQGSNTDFLICAAAVRRQFAILTTDSDFVHYAKLLPIQLHAARS